MTPKPREIVEDTAVAVADLPAYIAEFDRLLAEKYGIDCVHYAHAGAGELHLRPLFDLRSPEGLAMFRDVATDVAAPRQEVPRQPLAASMATAGCGASSSARWWATTATSSFGGSSGPSTQQGIFNPGKIVDAPPMDTQLRILPGEPEPDHATPSFASPTAGGILRAAEKCTGVGQCRKPAAAGGTMCPSYMATRDEDHTTRARANVLRQALADPAHGRSLEPAGTRRRDGSLPLLQGLQERVPLERRHGPAQGGVGAAPPRCPGRAAAEPACRGLGGGDAAGGGGPLGL